MADRPLDAWDLTEEISDALHIMGGLETALVRELEDLLVHAGPAVEGPVLALIAAQGCYRARAERLCRDIALQSREVT